MTKRNIQGKYDLVAEIGRGENGASWLAFDRRLRRDVVVKLLPPETVASAELLAGFERRAAAVSHVSHANVARVRDYGVDPVEGPFLVKERFQGEDIGQRVARVGRVPLGPAVTWIAQAARGLSAAHDLGVIHGAIHPGNLFLMTVEGDEVLKLQDFRVAAGPGDVRADLSALAAVAWLAITGRSARGSDAASAAGPSAQVPALGAAVDAFFERALADDPARRFATAKEFIDALGALVTGSGRPRTQKVLVVDDEPDAAMLIRQRFRQQIRAGSYEFVFASDGADALQCLDEHDDFAAVLSDLNMPRMDGLTFLSSAREQRSHLKVIIVSAYGDLGNIRAAMNRGAFDFVTKPIDFTDLEATLQKAIREVTLMREALRRRAEAEQARANLARYFPPSMVEMLATGEMSFRTGSRSPATALFADIVAFTPMTETMAPEEVLALLREFHGTMESEVFRHGGTLEKYIGDALYAIFGMPEPTPSDASNALACARAMMAALRRMNEARVARAEVPVRVGIGLHHGPVVIGDIGTERNMAVVAIGDTVNVASRVQALTREYGSPLVITQEVVEAVRAHPGSGHTAEGLLAGFVDMGGVQLRGRNAPSHVWMLPREADEAGGDRPLERG